MKADLTKHYVSFHTKQVETVVVNNSSNGSIQKPKKYKNTSESYIVPTVDVAKPINARPTKVMPIAQPTTATPNFATPTKAMPIAQPIKAMPDFATPIKAMPANGTPTNPMLFHVSPINAQHINATPTNTTPTNTMPINATPINATPGGTPLVSLSFKPSLTQNSEEKVSEIDLSVPMFKCSQCAYFSKHYTDLEQHFVSVHEENDRSNLSDEQIHEIDEQIHITDKQFQESDEQIHDTDKQFQEANKQLQEADEQFQVADEQFLKTDKQFMQTDEQIQQTEEQIQPKDEQIQELDEQMEIKEEDIDLPEQAENRVLLFDFEKVE